jgi:hypothetical protein
LGYNTYLHGSATRKFHVAVLNKQKSHFFSFFYYKIREQEGGTGPDCWWGEVVDISGRRGEEEKL